jgi:hypothetical protein
MDTKQKTDLSVSMMAANFLSLLIALPLIVLLAGLYLLRWWGQVWAGTFVIEFRTLLLSLVVFFAGVVVHELIHAASWMVFGRVPRNAIAFGIDKKTLSPYTHLKEPLEVNRYRIGGVMPGLVMGILPALAAVVTGSGWLLGFGLLFTLAAGGDFLILWLIRKVPGGRMVEDHPTRGGCIVTEE